MHYLLALILTFTIATADEPYEIGLTEKLEQTFNVDLVGSYTAAEIADIEDVLARTVQIAPKAFENRYLILEKVNSFPCFQGLAEYDTKDPHFPHPVYKIQLKGRDEVLKGGRTYKHVIAHEIGHVLTIGKTSSQQKLAREFKNLSVPVPILKRLDAKPAGFISSYGYLGGFFKDTTDVNVLCQINKSYELLNETLQNQKIAKANLIVIKQRYAETEELLKKIPRTSDKLPVILKVEKSLARIKVDIQNSELEVDALDAILQSTQLILDISTLDFVNKLSKSEWQPYEDMAEAYVAALSLQSIPQTDLVVKQKVQEVKNFLQQAYSS